MWGDALTCHWLANTQQFRLVPLQRTDSEDMRLMDAVSGGELWALLFTPFWISTWCPKTCSPSVPSCPLLAGVFYFHLWTDASFLRWTHHQLLASDIEELIKRQAIAQLLSAARFIVLHCLQVDTLQWEVKERRVVSKRASIPQSKGGTHQRLLLVFVIRMRVAVGSSSLNGISVASDVKSLVGMLEGRLWKC